MKNNNCLLKALSLSLFFSTLTLGNLALSEVRYIDDTLRIPLRTGASTEHRIISFLNSGTKVDQKELSEDEGWALVNVGTDKEGWVQVRYLKNTPAAKELLIYSQRELEKVKKQNREYNQTIKELNNEVKTLKQQLADLTKHSEKTDKELAHIKDISKNAIRLDHNNSKLLEENELLKASQEENQQLITKLESNQKNTGIVYGALAVLIGIILGWLMPKMKSNRNDGWV